MAYIDLLVAALRRKVRVKAPLSLLQGPELETFLLRGYAPEICFESWDLDRMAPEQLRPLAGELRARELIPTVHGPFLGLDPGSPRDLDRATARMYMEGHRALDRDPASGLRGLSWRRAERGNAGRTGALGSRSRWSIGPGWPRPWTAWAASWPWRTWWTGSPSPWPCFWSRFPRRAGALTSGTSGFFDRVGLEHWVAVLGPRLTHLHLHDNLGRGDDHLPLGQGTMDLARIFALLAGFPEPTATFEVDHRTGVEQSLPVLAEHWPWPGGPDSRD